MTDPEFADATYLEPITPEFVTKIIEKERPDALLATLGGQTALNAAMALHEAGVLEQYGVELIGADVDAIRRGEDRQEFKEIVETVGGESARSVVCHTMDERARRRRRPRLPGRRPPQLHHGRRRRRHRPRRGRPAPHRRRRAARQRHHRGAARGVDPRLEGVRARADARQERQRRRHLLDREPRPDGRAHRRLGHRRAGDDADRPRVPADARPRDRHHPRRRRRHRRLQHPVRGRPRRRPHRRHRDEPARLAGRSALASKATGFPIAKIAARLADRLHPRRDPQRHHPRDPGELRAEPRLRRGEDPALRVREVPRRRPDASPPR